MPRPTSQLRRSSLRSARAFAAFALALAGLAALDLRAAAATSEIEFFEKKIRPLLAEHCYECHSADRKVKAGLRLDTPEGWLVGGDSGPAVMPGKVDASRLIRAIRGVDNEVEAMPPKTTLSPEEVGLFEEWIRRGAHAPAVDAKTAVAKSSGLSVAEGKTFWAFVPVAHRPSPALRQHAAWARTDIDRFVAAEWETRQLAPAADADRTTLVRRVYFDLIGLPPSPEQVEAFVSDRRPDALARLVDELLASPHFGERWGRRWLDVARFAESSGGGRTLLFKDAWRYRDYVINAFNRDVPFDTFIREQIAGDLLPHASSEQRARQLTATGFLALGPTNYEEQNKVALRMDIVDEQLDTIGKAFLGMTIGCARCHDHKFDPIPTRDYYALAGILRSTRTLENYTDNVAKWVDAPLPADDRSTVEHKAHAEKVAQLETELKRLRSTAQPAGRGAGAGDLSPGQPLRLDALTGIVIDEANARVVGDWRTSTFARNYIGDGYFTDLNEAKGAKTLTFTPSLPKSGRYEVRFAYTPYTNRASNTPITILHADGEKTIRLDQRDPPPINGRFVSLGQFRFEKDGEGYVLISNEGTDGFVVADAVQFIPADQAAPPVEEPTGPPSAEAKAAATTAASIRRLEAELKKLNTQSPRRELTMSVAESDDIGDTEIRIRGNVRTLGAKVPRGFLQVATNGPAPEIPASESGRRQLADWIASADNPLTARVAANRAWTWLLGAGLVRSVDNFGTTGERPTNLALLDHLARQFVADGWSLKKLVRAIVLSRTYQLASEPAAASRTADPDNRYFSHANRRRLEAEQIRDAILWASGDLKLDVGGPNIGDGPNGAANLPVNAEYAYVYKDTRRSVYTPAFRNKRLELFEVFDFGDINAPAGQRNVSTVAPQALFMMNHPFVVEQAKRAAARALRTSDRSDAARIDEAYRLALSRTPTPRERELAHDFIRAADAEANATPLEDRWAQLFQALFASIDFRYLN